MKFFVISVLLLLSTLFSLNVYAKDGASFDGPPLSRHQSGVTGTIRVGKADAILSTQWCGSSPNAVRDVAVREAAQFADLFQVRPLELLANSFDAPSPVMPNSRRLFQTLPSAVMAIKSKEQLWCIHSELPLSEANGAVCSPFLKRALLSAHNGNESAALAFLLEADMGKNFLSIQGDVVAAAGPLGNSRSVPFWESREAFLAEAAQSLRSELDRAVALAWKHHTSLSFKLTTDGKRGSYSVSLSLGGENSDDDAKKAKHLRMTTRVEQLSEVSHVLRFLVKAEPARFKMLGGRSFILDVLVRLPRHLAKLDERELQRSSNFATAWWKYRDGQEDDVQSIEGMTVVRAADIMHHPEEARSWDGVWLRVSFVMSAEEIKKRLTAQSFFAVLELRGIVVPRLPVEAYPPDLNRLAALPAALVALSSGASQGTARDVCPVMDALESSSGRPSASHPYGPFVRSENQVSLYQPGPDRAVPFVVLAFAALPISVLLIRIVAAVAKG